MSNLLEKILKESSLEFKEREELYKILILLPNHDIQKTTTFLSAHKEWVEKIFENYKQKKAAHEASNVQAWQKIIAEEIKSLEEIK